MTISKENMKDGILKLENFIFPCSTPPTPPPPPPPKKKKKKKKKKQRATNIQPVRLLWELSIMLNPIQLKKQQQQTNKPWKSYMLDFLPRYTFSACTAYWNSQFSGCIVIPALDFLLVLWTVHWIFCCDPTFQWSKLIVKTNRLQIGLVSHKIKDRESRFWTRLRTNRLKTSKDSFLFHLTSKLNLCKVIFYCHRIESGKNQEILINLKQPLFDIN